ncbi:MAG TPA: sialidase family protein [Kofleriaceae bacterium]|nr:sialidase family protein [Kofleriaceae bacterium]
MSASCTAVAGLVLAIAATSTCAAPQATAPSTPGVEWSSPIELARGGGERGPWQQNDSRYDYVDDPTVALRGDGATIVAWVDHRAKDLFVQTYRADGRPERAPINVSRSPATFSWLPRLAISPRDPEHLFLVWQEIVFTGGSHGGDIYFARSRDGGATWSPPLDLSRASLHGDGKARITKSIWHNGSLDLAVAEHAIYAAWTDYEGTLHVASSDDDGASFSAPRALAGDASRPARAPALAIGPHALYLAWTLGEDDRADIHVMRSDDAGRTWTAPTIVERTPHYSDAPKLAVDRNGTLHVVYAESTGGPFDRFTIRYTRSRDEGRTFAPARALSGVGGHFPALAIDERDHLFVLWEVFVAGAEQPRGLAFAESFDDGATFTAPSAIANSSDPQGGWNGSHQGRLMNKLAVRAGRIAVVNSSLEPGDHSRVWLIRGRMTTHPTTIAPVSPLADVLQARQDRD